MSTDVEQTAILLRIGSWVCGSRRSPTLHMSNSFQRVPWRISCIPGVFIRAEPLGCSKSKWFWCSFWKRYKTTAKKICQSCCSRLFITRSHPSRDLFMLNWLHWHHGPHSGLTHTCFGCWVARIVKSRLRPSTVLRSPCKRTNLCAFPPSLCICLVSSLSPEHMTSSKSSLGCWHLGLDRTWTTMSCSSLENFLTSRWIRALKLLCSWLGMKSKSKSTLRSCMWTSAEQVLSTARLSHSVDAHAWGPPAWPSPCSWCDLPTACSP